MQGIQVGEGVIFSGTLSLWCKIAERVSNWCHFRTIKLIYFFQKIYQKQCEIGEKNLIKFNHWIVSEEVKQIKIKSRQDFQYKISKIELKLFGIWPGGAINLNTVVVARKIKKLNKIAIPKWWRYIMQKSRIDSKLCLGTQTQQIFNWIE